MSDKTIDDDNQATPPSDGLEELARAAIVNNEGETSGEKESAAIIPKIDEETRSWLQTVLSPLQEGMTALADTLKSVVEQQGRLAQDLLTLKAPTKQIMSGMNSETSNTAKKPVNPLESVADAAEAIPKAPQNLTAKAREILKL